MEEKQLAYFNLSLNLIKDYTYYKCILETGNKHLEDDLNETIKDMYVNLSVVRNSLERALETKPFLKQDIEFINKFINFLETGNYDAFNKHYDTLEKRIIAEAKLSNYNLEDLKEMKKDIKEIVNEANKRNVTLRTNMLEKINGVN